tara:strand:+ start:590 stop:976 length:387 start_codon:yes stop_codon:yes gene_type:complete
MDTTIAGAIAERGTLAYLISVGDDGPHTGNVQVELRGPRLYCALGTSASRNVGVQPAVSLLWPPEDPRGYALIVNGTVETGTVPDQAGDAGLVPIRLTKAVWHRPGVPTDPSSPCTSDCVRVEIGASA